MTSAFSISREMIARTDTNLYLSLVFQPSSEHISASLTSPPSLALSSSLLSCLHSGTRSCACQASVLPLSYFPGYNTFSLKQKFSSSSSHQPYLEMLKKHRFTHLRPFPSSKKKYLVFMSFKSSFGLSPLKTILSQRTTWFRAYSKFNVT